MNNEVPEAILALRSRLAELEATAVQPSLSDAIRRAAAKAKTSVNEGDLGAAMRARRSTRITATEPTKETER